MEPRALGYVVVVAVTLGACGGDGVADGGAGDAAVDAGVSTPDIPWLAEGVAPIAIVPCPEGWREVAGDVATCDPYPEGGPATCDVGEAHFPGEAGCRPIGDPCPAGDWASTLPTDGAVIYVKAGAAAGGDGSQAAPFASISEVRWASLAAHTTVALAKGTYDGNIALKAGMRVIGACVGETIIRGAAGPLPAVIFVSTAGEPAVLQNVTITNAAERGVLVEAGRAALLQGVVIERARTAGLVVAQSGTSVELHDVVVGRTEPSAGENGRGIDVELGAELWGSRVLVVEAHEVGVYAANTGTVVALTDLVVADTQVFAGDGERGIGVEVHSGARFESTRLLVTRNHDVGVHAGITGTEVILTDAVVSDTLPRTDRRYGRGIAIELGARLAATRLLVTQSRDLGLRCADEGSECVVSDAVVRDTQSREYGGDYGRGIGVYAGGRLEASRLLVAANRQGGIVGIGVGSEITLVDTAVRDTEVEEASLTFGNGIVMQDGARLSGERVLVSGSHELGIVSGTGASIDLREAAIASVSPAECDCPERNFGHAAAALSGSLRLIRFAIRDATTCGLLVARLGDVGTSSLDVETGAVERTGIGACVQVDGYDFTRLTTGVVYQDNGRSLDSTMLPVPPLGEVGDP